MGKMGFSDRQVSLESWVCRGCECCVEDVAMVLHSSSHPRNAIDDRNRNAPSSPVYDLEDQFFLSLLESSDAHQLNNNKALAIKGYISIVKVIKSFQDDQFKFTLSVYLQCVFFFPTR
jgi:hypothetical protein